MSYLLREKILDLFSTDLKFFDGMNTNSISRGIEDIGARGEVDRYRLSFDGDFSFLRSFMNELENNLYKPSKCTNEDNCGYIYPSQDSIDYYISKQPLTQNEKEHEKESVLNKDFQTIHNYMNHFVEDIQNNFEAVRHKVKFITGKVGSGKSTFVNYLNVYFKDELKSQKIIFSKIIYEDLKLEDYSDKYNIENNFANNIKSIIFKKIITACFDLGLIKQIDDWSFLTDRDHDLSLIRRIVNSNLWNNSEKVDKLDEMDELNIETLFRYFYIEKEFRFLVVIDGLDKLDPRLIHHFRNYIDIIQDVIYNDILPDMTVSYILTLRSCTFAEFKRQNVSTKILVPPKEIDIINEAIRKLADKNSFYKQFYEQFQNIFEVILKQLEINFECKKFNKTVIEIFDYNFRLLLRYLHHIICFTVDSFAEKSFYDRRKIILTKDQHSDFQTFINIVTSNHCEEIKELLEKKSYVLDDILLLKHSIRYTPLYQIKNKKDNKYDLMLTRYDGAKFLTLDSISFFDNIYNYTLSSEMFDKKSVFPLLVKIRILQIFDFFNRYCEPKEIEHELKLLGYITKL